MRKVETIDKPITLAQINEARAKLNYLNNGAKVRDDEGACRFIRERGFVLLMPINGVPLPSLSEADDAIPWDGYVCTDRAWAWKETLPAQKKCAYTKLIHGRGTFIDWALYPSFLKVYGPEGDADYEYENGRLERTEWDLYHLVAEFGPIDSRKLWQRAKPVFGGKRHRFTAALERLQSRFFLTVAGGTLEGWTLHTWDLVERQVPADVLLNLPSPSIARRKVLCQALQNCIAATEKMLRLFLRWSPADLRECLTGLRKEGLLTEVEVEEESWMAFNRSV